MKKSITRLVMLVLAASSLLGLSACGTARVGDYCRTVPKADQGNSFNRYTSALSYGGRFYGTGDNTHCKTHQCERWYEVRGETGSETVKNTGEGIGAGVTGPAATYFGAREIRHGLAKSGDHISFKGGNAHATGGAANADSHSLSDADANATADANANANITTAAPHAPKSGGYGKK